MSALGDRYHALPRVGQWIVLATIGIAAYFAWEQFVQPTAAEWASQADAIERSVEEVRRGATIGRAARANRSVITRLGPVEFPDGEEAGRIALTRLVADTLKDYRTVEEDSFTLGRGVTNLPRSIAAQVQIGRQRLVQITGDLRFDASPEEAMEILAEFEARPEIETVSQVRFLRQDGRTVSMTMKLDAWVLQDRARRVN